MENIMAGYERKYLFELKITRQTLELLKTFVPYYFRHLIYRPHRRNISPVNYEYPHVGILKRAAESALDVIYSLMLEGYAELVGLKVRNGTGLLLKFLIEDLTRPLDDVLEDELITKDTVDIETLLETPKLKNPCDTLRDYTSIYGVSENVIDYLHYLFSLLFEDYWNTLKKANNTREFVDVFEAVKIDNGILVADVMQVVRLFNNHDCSKDAQYNLQRDFYFLGIVGKLADDIVDLKRDIKRDCINLLYALVSQNQPELQNLNTAIRSGDRLSIWWWRKYCPVSFARYYCYIERHYNQITSSKLKITANLLLLRAGIARHYDAR
jgi:hypothetical protein